MPVCPGTSTSGRSPDSSLVSPNPQLCILCLEPPCFDLLSLLPTLWNALLARTSCRLLCLQGLFLPPCLPLQCLCIIHNASQLFPLPQSFTLTSGRPCPQLAFCVQTPCHYIFLLLIILQSANKIWVGQNVKH